MLQVEGGGAIAQARLLKKPTATWRAPMRQPNQWRLISHLSLNHLSLVAGRRDALLDLLSLYNFVNRPSLRKPIAWIIPLASPPPPARLGPAQRPDLSAGPAGD